MNPHRNKRIGVLLGGPSAEREVSLNTGKGVLAALRERGLEAVAIDWQAGQDLSVLLRSERIEVVWNALHGTPGEDGTVQGLLECLGIPYTGSGVLASAAAMDKLVAKRLFAQGGVPTPAWYALDGEDAAARAAELGYPVVVKPAREGSTVGITIVKAEPDLDAAVAAARRCHGAPLLEAFIPGRELSVGVLDGQVLGTVEIRPKKGFYDYAAKYVTGDTEYLVPAPVEPIIEKAACAVGLAAYLALGCHGHARTDVRVDPEGGCWVLEVNTLPGMTGTSLLPKIARHAGIEYGELVDRILATATLGT
jgi:D-alanine-D-alanine ligase